ncbi:hypothetical protein [Paractinoplanes brasiliensis]|uniref:Uncharacterized protein n=1 Tax=Paractinoplanes brasiliensis TaxID=52695 RepID=A0A4R6JBA8_9ACTN|nr:hypothetical protein [Actinoplanes brasiliensis]TDO33004.1 hypothetical protein C8E87_8484 [Actinoplanes brasiliensis]GID28723.1 hypothetical protein Abr02nite_37060 [Actinoplanes brasiliensis]
MPVRAAVTGSLPSPAGGVVTGVLLPAPAGTVSVTAVDVSPLGVVAGTAEGLPQRWAKLPGAGWLRQPLALPAGATAGTVTGVTDLGEAAGSVTVDDATRAVRWSVSGLSSTLVPGTRADAVGPRGTLGVSTVATEPAAESDLVARDGSRTPLRDTPELGGGYRRTVSSVGGPGTAVVWVTDGIGKGTTARPVLWRDGATLRLPVFSSFFLSGACVTRVLPDGTVVFSGYNNDNGTISYDLVKHTGGVPGTSVLLARATPAGGTIAGLTCGSAQSPLNALASDGGFTGQAAQQAAYWTPAGEGKSIPYAEGERSSTGVAAASGGRVIVRAERSDGSVCYSLWRNGVRTPLAAPAGWSISNVVELTDAGLLVANVRNEAGTLRPAAWQL